MGAAILWNSSTSGSRFAVSTGHRSTARLCITSSSTPHGCADRVVLVASRRADRVGAAARRRRVGFDRATRRRHLPRASTGAGRSDPPRSWPRPHSRRRPRRAPPSCWRAAPGSNTSPCAAVGRGSPGSPAAPLSSPSRTHWCSAAKSTATSSSAPTIPGSAPCTAAGVVASGVERLVVSRSRFGGMRWDVGVEITGGAGHIVESCEFHHHLCAYRVSDTVGTTVRGNSVVARWWGVHLVRTEAANVVGNAFADTMRAVDVDAGAHAQGDRQRGA